jgi:hypothetical protein
MSWPSREPSFKVASFMARYCRASMLKPRRLATIVLLTLGVVLLHWAGIGGMRFESAPKRARSASPALQTRNVAPPALIEPAPVERVVEASPPRPRARTAPAPQPLPAALAPSDAGAELPVYPTRPPPPVRWAYTVERGPLTGEGVLNWQPDGASYTARFEAQIAGRSVLDWSSRGAFDAAGLAPERFVVRRRSRDALAANFQRAAGKITYSGPGVEHALPPGAQDRLSWMIQLPAIVAATPERFAAAGATVVMFVSGAHGDGDAWTFQVIGHERVTRADGEGVDALKLVRHPARPYDTRVEVWLDPARHHLPLRMRLSNEGRDGALELMHVPSP